MPQQLLAEPQTTRKGLSGAYIKCFFDRLLTDTGLQKGAVIRKANIPRTYGYQIMGGTRIAKRDYYIAIAIAMSLDLTTTQRLLAITGGGVLYQPLKRDAAIISAIEQGYDRWELHELLRARSLPPLGAGK